MKLIQFQSNNIIYPISTSLLNFVHLLFAMISNNLTFYPLFFCLTVPLLYSIFPETITQYNTQRKSKQQTTNKQALLTQLIFREKEKITLLTAPTPIIYQHYLWILLLGFCRFISDFQLRFFTNLQFQGYSMMVSFACLIFTWIFTYMKTKEPFGRHRIISIAFLAVIYSIEIWLFHNDLYTQINRNFGNKIYFYIILLFIQTICIATKEVTEKNLMEYYFISPYMLLFYEGVISATLAIVLLFILHIIPPITLAPFDSMYKQSRWDKLRYDFLLVFNFSDLQTLYAWLMCITVLLLNCVRIQMNRQLTPTHRYISENLSNIYFIVFQLFRKVLKMKALRPFDNLIVALILEMIGLVGYCVYNEHIIIYVYGIHKDTKKEINARAIEDIQINNCVGLFNEEDDELEEV